MNPEKNNIYDAYRLRLNLTDNMSLQRSGNKEVIGRTYIFSQIKHLISY